MKIRQIKSNFEFFKVQSSSLLKNGDLAPTRTGMSSLGNYHSILLNYEVMRQ
jgi:hypothetical protein